MSDHGGGHGGEVAGLSAVVDLHLSPAGIRNVTNALTGIQHQLGHFVHATEAYFGIHFLEGLIHQTIGAAVEVEHAAQRIGITTEEVQALGLAAQMTGADVGQLEVGLRFLAKNAYEASNGSSEQAKNFAQLGVKYKDANGHVMAAGQLLEQVADRVKATEDPTKRTAIAVKLLGRGGAALLPLLQQGSEGIQKFREEAEELGGGFGEDFIHQAAETEHEIFKFQFALRSISSKLVGVFLPAITKAVGGLIGLIKWINKTMEANKFLQYTIELTTAALLAWGAASLYAARAAIAMIIIAAVFDEIHGMLTGGKSLFGQWLDQWAGIGTVDKAVRSWAAGIQLLVKAFKDLAEGKKLLDFSTIKELFTGAGDAQKQTMKEAEMRGHLAAAREAANSKDPVLAAIGKRELDKLKAENFGLARPEAAGQGLGAARLGMSNAGQANGVAAQREVGKSLGLLGLGGGDVHGAHGEVHAPGSHGETTVNQENHTEIHVHAKTDADPETIARVAGEVHDAKHAQHLKQARQAIGRRPAPNGENVSHE
jgi:hypothetical protein